MKADRKNQTNRPTEKKKIKRHIHRHINKLKQTHTNRRIGKYMTSIRMPLNCLAKEKKKRNIMSPGGKATKEK